MNCVQNGYKYAVWGTSKDPSTWWEQNTTLNGAPARQLRRQVIEKMMDKEDDAVSMLANVDGADDDDQDFGEDVPVLPDVELESTDKKAFETLVDAIHKYAGNPQNFFSTLDINQEIDLATLSRIKDFAKKKFGLVDIQSLSMGKRITLKLIGFRHHEAKPAIND